jgi:hypothetical protein
MACAQLHDAWRQKLLPARPLVERRRKSLDAKPFFFAKPALSAGA